MIRRGEGIEGTGSCESAVMSERALESCCSCSFQRGRKRRTRRRIASVDRWSCLAISGYGFLR